jgi:phosphohistidine phosphatase
VRFYVIRHATAEPAREGLDDANRALTDRGRKRARRAFRGLARIATIDRVLASPLVRARETADLLASELDLGPPEEAIELAPEGDLAALVERLSTSSPETGVALVGHMPSLGELVAKLAGGRGLAVDLKRASVAALMGEPREGGAVLEWLLPPRILRTIR